MNGKIVVLTLIFIAFALCSTASASTFANVTAQYLVYFTGIKAQILGAIVNNPTLNVSYVYSLASLLYDNMKIQAAVYAVLANYTAGAGAAFPFPFVNFTLNSSLIDFSEYTAILIYSVERIKADVMYLLSSPSPTGYLDEYANAVARELLGRMKVMAKVYEILNNT